MSTATPNAALPPGHPGFATEFVDQGLERARQAGASDVHWVPTAEGLETWWRIDGALRKVGSVPASVAPNVVARLKVLAGLLTYRTDLPQEGRIRGGPGDVEMRASTFPTLHGEKAVVRLFAGPGRFQRLDDLGLPDDLVAELVALLGETSGAILLSGPAGSGKTTTLYACLRELVAANAGRRSLVALEDPIEVAVPGVAQSQVNPAAGFDLAAGLRSLVRQDPEVIGIGEIRDRTTAEVALQASLTGHLVLATFHAGGAAGALGRLLDMGLEPYALRSGVLASVGLQLVRTLCDDCAEDDDDPDARLGLAVERWRKPIGCPNCGETGYRGRAVLAEILHLRAPAVGRAILDRLDVDALADRAVEAGMLTRLDRARAMVEAGRTTPGEVRRVLGFAGRSGRI